MARWSLQAVLHGIDSASLERACRHLGVSRDEWISYWAEAGIEQCDPQSDGFDSESAEDIRKEILARRVNAPPAGKPPLLLDISKLDLDWELVQRAAEWICGSIEEVVEDMIKQQIGKIDPKSEGYDCFYAEQLRKSIIERRHRGAKSE